MQDRGNLQGFADRLQSRPGQGCGAGVFQTGLGIGHGSAAGVQDQDIIGNELPCDGGMSQVLAEILGLLQPTTPTAPGFTGLDGLEKWCRCAAEGGQDGFNGKAANLVDRRDRNKNPFGLAVGEIFHGHTYYFPATLQGIFRSKFPMFGIRKFCFGRGGDEVGMVTGGNFAHRWHDALVIHNHGFDGAGEQGQFWDSY